jgi:cystathionine beta-lyase
MSIFDQKIDRTGMSTMKWESEIERTGKDDLLCYGTADMDFLSPQPILDAIHQVANIGHMGYPYIKQSYYEAIINWMKRHAKWEIQKEWISNNVGIWPASWTIIDALTEPGDEIIFQTPAHFCFDVVTRESKRIVVVNPLIQKDGYYMMDFEGLERCITEKTKVFWLCNPHNPVGRAWNRDELEKISNICLAHDIKIISDDVYCGLLYPGTQYTPIATISKETSMNTITCYSTSKTYNTTGDKHSYVVCENPEILQAYNQSLKKQNLEYGVNIFGLAITEAAYNHCDQWVNDLMKHIQSNYLLVKETVEEKMPSVKLTKAEATYFAWLDFSELKISRDQLENFFENDANVSVGMGYKFLEGGEGFIRLNMACSRDTLQSGLDRITYAYKKIVL